MGSGDSEIIITEEEMIDVNELAKVSPSNGWQSYKVLDYSHNKNGRGKKHRVRAESSDGGKY